MADLIGWRIADAGLADLFLGAADRTQEILEDRLLQFVPDRR
jgi:hypothetical protein